ncbi:DUF1348 family protein [Pedobacter westerhofensis]|uniref:DUF1348 family protein n=1 Tax=Pedobacter westerhofensis TaxID=425512 RepID=UPI0029395198|nr:DUF1348 family protein [Pedobacter westerhofensis]
MKGREQIIPFPTDKWKEQLGYKLKREIWSFFDNRIAVLFQYEYYNTDGHL